MAIEATHLTTGTENETDRTKTTASISPTEDSLVLIAVSQRFDSSESFNAIDSVSGCNLNWVKLGEVWSDGFLHNAVFRAMGTPSSGSLTITINNSISNSDIQNTTWNVDEFSGLDSSGSDGENAVAQSKFATISRTSGTSGTFSLTLDSAPSSGNAVYGTTCTNRFGNDISPADNFVELGYTGTNDHQSQWKNDNDQTIDWNHTDGGDFETAGVELSTAELPSKPTSMMGGGL